MIFCVFRDFLEIWRGPDLGLFLADSETGSKPVIRPFTRLELSNVTVFAFFAKRAKMAVFGDFRKSCKTGLRKVRFYVPAEQNSTYHFYKFERARKGGRKVNDQFRKSQLR